MLTAVTRHLEAKAIEAVISRAEPRAALVLVNENVPPTDVSDPDDWRCELVARHSAVSGFVKPLPTVIAFGANAEEPRSWRRCRRCRTCWPTAVA